MEDKEKIDAEEAKVEEVKEEKREPKKPSKKGRGCLTFMAMVAIYIMIKLLMAETSDKPQYAPSEGITGLKTQHSVYVPKAALPSALVPVMGGLESLFPDLPAGLNFGDAAETVITKMGRQPDMRLEVSDNIYHLIFKATELHGFQGSGLVFVFIDDVLERVRIRFEYTIKNDEDRNASNNAIAGIDNLLLDFLGEPKTSFPNKIEDIGATIISSWEPQDNLILFMLDGNRAGFLVITISLGPLSPSRPYKNILTGS